jgi:hypothetical protein
MLPVDREVIMEILVYSQIDAVRSVWKQPPALQPEETGGLHASLQFVVQANPSFELPPRAIPDFSDAVCFFLAAH